MWARLSDLREYVAIEQDVDMVMLLYRDEYYYADSEKKGTMDVFVIQKQEVEACSCATLNWKDECGNLTDR